jgi:hypothetical protein
MQTGEWMAYSCSLHFSDLFPYITLCIWSYRFKDMILARFYKSKIRELRRGKTGPAASGDD